MQTRKPLNESLREKGYRPINLVILHESNVAITPTNSTEDYLWWKAELDEGKTVTITGGTLEDLASFFKIKTKEFRSSAELSDFKVKAKVELENGNEHGQTLLELWGKISEQNLLTLVAILNDPEKPEPRISTHNEKFSVSWMHYNPEDLPL